MKRWGFLVSSAFLLAGVCAGSAFAGNGQLDKASAEALQKTMNFLQSDVSRGEVISANPDAQTVDAQVKSLSGNKANTEAVYSLSSEVFSNLVQQTGGDPVKMQQIMQQAKENPKAFFDKYFSTADKAKLKNLADKLENSPTAKQPIAR